MNKISLQTHSSHGEILIWRFCVRNNMTLSNKTDSQLSEDNINSPIQRQMVGIDCMRQLGRVGCVTLNPDRNDPEL
jgi:hypothetical protein